MPSVMESRCDMREVPHSVVLDTNVILDCYFADRPGAKDSIEAVNIALEHDVTLLYSAAQAKDVFFLAAMLLKSAERATSDEVSIAAARSINETCWAILDNLDSYASVVGADESDVWLAKKHRAVHGDFEDNLVIASALRANADFIVTKDEQLLKHAPIAALAPHSFVALMSH